MHWRRCLQQVHDRRGAIDVAIARETEKHDDDGSPQLVWRVKILAISDDEIHIEQPTALGQVIPLQPGVELVAFMRLGQNRWTFSTENLGATDTGRHGRPMPGLRLRMPAAVQRCQRRSQRVDAIRLPEVDLWPLLDARSVVVAERACELQFERADRGIVDPAPASEEELMPEVGPRFAGTILNIGGGGVGLNVLPEHQAVLNRHKLFWLRLKLPPARTPICATVKLVHTHMQSDQCLYAGMAFDFTFNALHQRLIVNQIRRYIADQQRAQLNHGEVRRSA